MQCRARSASVLGEIVQEIRILDEAGILLPLDTEEGMHQRRGQLGEWQAAREKWRMEPVMTFFFLLLDRLRIA